jgi:hypothetical protein
MAGAGCESDLAQRPLGRIAEPGQGAGLPRSGYDNVKPRYLEFGVVIESAPVPVDTGRRTKSHLPISMDSMAKLAAAMIALDHDLLIHEFAGTLRLLAATIGVATACS